MNEDQFMHWLWDVLSGDEDSLLDHGIEVGSIDKGLVVKLDQEASFQLNIVKVGDDE